MIALLIKPVEIVEFTQNRSDVLPGKFRQRVRSVSPVGDMQRTTCRLTEHLVTKYCQRLSFAGLAPFFIASSRTYMDEGEGDGRSAWRLTSPMIFSRSSSAKRAGTIPVVSMLLINSRNPRRHVCRREISFQDVHLLPPRVDRRT